MANPMMQMLQGNGNQNLNNPLSMIAEFRKFAAGMTPQMARQQVEQMLSSGKISQQQFQNLQQQAKAFSALLSK